eukprot:TRINITY_DN7521_c0_g1_i5.p1 TRINITY_DN7521_c0_g1~~TRINITY_DN7521_c0_g1_i5.p1  ORF type:complete len:188 (+),score=55.58 TRINITY_DN7521_c0_g1_i5:45-608(+)
MTSTHHRLSIFFFLIIRRPPRSTLSSSSAASDVYKRQGINAEYGGVELETMDAIAGLPTSMRNSLKRFYECATAESGNGEDVVAYYLKLYMVQLAITKGKAIAAEDPEGNQAARVLASSLMTELGAAKAALAEQLEDGEEYFKEYAVNMFELAEIEDLAGMATANTAKGLQKAHMMFEACRQFGALR